MENPIFKKRKQHDLNILIESKYKVNTENTDKNIFYVRLDGPSDSLYKGGLWDIIIELPLEYPYKSPSIGFVNKIYHPNVDFASGTICLDVINETWSPMYSLFNIIDVFLPQLLTYPNPSDPLNIKASEEMLNNISLFEENIKINIEKYAKKNISSIKY